MTPEILHHFSDNLYAKETKIPAGHVLVQHKHKFSHLSIVAQGTVEVSVDDDNGGRLVRRMTAPVCLEIKEGKNHSVVAITDVVWYCIHSTSEKDESKIDEVLIRVNVPTEGE